MIYIYIKTLYKRVPFFQKLDLNSINLVTIIENVLNVKEKDMNEP